MTAVATREATVVVTGEARALRLMDAHVAASARTRSRVVRHEDTDEHESLLGILCQGSRGDDARARPTGHSDN